jgi:hypothetical protein
MTAGGAHHLIMSNQDSVRNCAIQPCSLEQSGNYAANGNQYMGMSSDDYCNGYWGDPATPMCVFGSGSDARNMMVQAWQRGQLVQLSVHFPNPFNNWQIQAAGAATGHTCPGQSGITTQLRGLSDDCSSATGNLDADVQTMITPGTALNNQWNSELNNWAAELQYLQSQNIVVIMRLFHELDGGWFWWGNISPSTQRALFIYTEQYFEGTAAVVPPGGGVHNVLYEYCIIGSVYGYPGNQYVDILGLDQYSPATGNYTPQGYAQFAALAPAKPQSWPEYNCAANHTAACTATTDYGAYFQNAQSQMPNLVFASHWRDDVPGAAPNNNPYWKNDMANPYLVMLGSVP